jgi:hypothetical protein
MDRRDGEATLCPVCGSDQLTRTAFITPAGFAPDLNAKREVDRGQAISYAGMTDRARLEPQDPPGHGPRSAATAACVGGRARASSLMVNKGVGERGFRVCPDCGRAEPEYGPKFTTTKLMKKAADPTTQAPAGEGEKSALASPPARSISATSSRPTRCSFACA